jgi:hypothetical protein
MRWARDSAGRWTLGPFAIVEQPGNRPGARVTALECDPVYELHRSGKWVSDHASLRQAQGSVSDGVTQGSEAS